MAETKILKDIQNNVVKISPENVSEIDISDLKNESSNVFIRKTELDLLSNSICAPYDSTATYEVDDIAIHNNQLFRCTVAITEPEAFNPTHWTASTIKYNFVTKNSDQEIFGTKYFKGNVTFNSGFAYTGNESIIMNPSHLGVNNSEIQTSNTSVTIGAGTGKTYINYLPSTFHSAVNFNSSSYFVRSLNVEDDLNFIGSDNKTKMSFNRDGNLYFKDGTAWSINTSDNSRKIRYTASDGQLELRNGNLLVNKGQLKLNATNTTYAINPSSSLEFKVNDVNKFALGTAYAYFNYDLHVNSMGSNDKSVATKEYVDSRPNQPNLIEITWSELKTKRDNSQLIPGKQYRITDYTCTTTQENTSSAGHVFDIIVIADSVNKLNEEARACLHSGDTYFSSCKLEAWKLCYCLDNDTNRFYWADSTNGKGVIYHMIDEFNNDIPYDFKNILFTKSGRYTNAYTFSYTESSTIKDASILGKTKNCHNNTMKKYVYPNPMKQRLNFNVFYSTESMFNCNNNTFDDACSSHTFGYAFRHNIFGSNCYGNTFGNSCVYNTFGNSLHSNTFGNDCDNNIFGSSCSNNTFGNCCLHNIFGNDCSNNIFGNSCNYNIFGNDCLHNIFGNSCNYNIFGNRCFYNTFGDSSSSIDYYMYNIIDSGCEYLYIVGNGSAGTGNELQNIHIHLGVKGTSSSDRKTITVDRGLSYETNIVPVGTTTIEV